MKDKKNKNRFFGFIASLVLLAVSTAVGLLIVELVLSATGRFPLQKQYKKDAALGWVKKAGIPAPEKNGADVVIIGDSFTEKTEGFVSAFSNRLQKCDRDAKTINLGVAGYGTAQEYLMWKEHGEKYKPRLVILAVFMWNDLPDNLNDIFYDAVLNTDRPYFELSDNGELIRKRTVNSKTRTFLTHHSALARLTEDVYFNSAKFESLALKLKLKNQDTPQSYTRIEQWGDFYRKDGSPRDERAWKMMRALILKMKADVESSGTDFLLVAFDNCFTVEDKLARDLETQYGRKFSDLDRKRPMRKMKEFAKKNNIQYLDLTEVFLDNKNNDKDTELYNIGIAAHFNDAGIKIAGDSIFEKALESGFIECR